MIVRKLSDEELDRIKANNSFKSLTELGVVLRGDLKLKKLFYEKQTTLEGLK